MATSKQPTENKGGAAAQETKTDATEQGNGRAETYEQKATRGGHGVVGPFPHPFGSQLPSLGDVPEVQTDGAQG